MLDRHRAVSGITRQGPPFTPRSARPSRQARTGLPSFHGARPETAVPDRPFLSLGRRRADRVRELRPGTAAGHLDLLAQPPRVRPGKPGLAALHRRSRPGGHPDPVRRTRSRTVRLAGAGLLLRIPDRRPGGGGAGCRLRPVRPTRDGPGRPGFHRLCPPTPGPGQPAHPARQRRVHPQRFAGFGATRRHLHQDDRGGLGATRGPVPAGLYRHADTRRDARADDVGRRADADIHVHRERCRVPSTAQGCRRDGAAHRGSIYRPW